MGGALLLVGALVGGVLLLTSGSGGERGTDRPDRSAATGTGEESSGSASESASESPSESGSAAATGSTLTAEQFSEDWDFRLGRTSLSARHDQGWDYPDCAPVENKGALTAQGCERAVEVTYTAEDGRLRFTNLMLEMATPEQAAAAGRPGGLTDDDFRIREESFLQDAATGRWKAAHADRFVVITVVTAEQGVPEATVGDYLRWVSSDVSSDLLSGN